MTTRALDEYRAISMDCYGTLIDWETGIWEAFGPLLRANAVEMERPAVLSLFAELESAQERATPTHGYPEILAAVHREFAARHELATTRELDEAFGRSVPDWPAFDDSTDALRRLQQHLKLIILSNVDRASFAGSNARLAVTFDAIYTAEDIGSYKPDPANFRYLLDRAPNDVGVPPADILHVAQSLFHDHVPAAAAGLDRAWIDRQRLSEGGRWGATAEVPDRPEVDFTFFSMAAFADAVDSSHGR